MWLDATTFNLTHTSTALAVSSMEFNSVSEELHYYQTENKLLKVQTQQLKWIIVQFMQRYGRDLVLFHKRNPAKFAISIADSPDGKMLRISAIQDKDEKTSDPSGKTDLN